jgi:catechol 2,3-dioxygenase-like lactoylglutathione lyase family enzyme
MGEHLIARTPTVEIVGTQPLSPSSMRVARPVSQIPASLRFYVGILGLEQLGEFAGHSGYEGAFVGRAGTDWHIEFTSHESGMPIPSPTEEDLLVFYVSAVQLEAAALRLSEAGIGLVRHENPYWVNAGAIVCRDPDGYLVVLCPHSG